MNGPPTPTLSVLLLVQFIGVEQMTRRAPAAVARAVQLAEGLLTRLTEEHGGRISTSDLQGSVVECADPRAALTMALRLQAELLDLPWPDALGLQPEAREERDANGNVLFRGLRARVAVHWGWATRQFGSLFGPGLYQLARIASVGSGGQTLVSEHAWKELTGSLPGRVVVRDLGAHRLPGVHGQSRLFQILPEALDRRPIPPLATSDRSNVPPPSGPILGRDGDLLAVSELFGLGVRVVTIVGPEGIGRRRFVEQVARRPPVHTASRGGARLVHPTNPSALELVRATGAALGMPTAAAGTLDKAIEQTGHALAALGPLLLAFDGEVGAVDVIDRWAELAPQVRMLLQGVRPVGAKAEVPFRLRHLPTPAAQAGRHDDAVRIYQGAALKVNPAFVLQDALDATIIAQAVDGRPHALQLAGAIVDRLPPDRLAAQVLGQHLDLDDLLSLVLRHLDDREREVLLTCSAIPSAFSDELVAWILEAPEDLPDTLDRLRRRGLVIAAPSADCPHSERWQVERNVRRSVLQQADPARLRDLERRASEGLVAGVELWIPYTLGPHRAEVLSRLAMDVPGLLWVAQARYDEEEQAVDVDLSARAVAALQPVLRSRGPLALERHMQDQVLARCDRQLDSDPIYQSRLLLARANGTVRAGRQAVWEVDLARAHSLVERWDDVDGQGRLALVEGRASRALGHPESAIRHLENARAIFETLGDDIRAAVADVEIGMVCVDAGHFRKAEESLQRAQVTLQDADCPHVRARALAALTTLFRRIHRTASARSTGREALRIYQATGSTVAACRLQRELALLDYQLARYHQATDSLQSAVATARSLGDRRLESESLYVLALVALSRRQHTEARRVLLEALALARDQRDGSREGEVLGLLGVMHHLDEHDDAASDFYARSIRTLSGRDGRRRRALFYAWWGAVEAEATRIDTAKSHFESAEADLAHSNDPEVAETLRILRLVLGLARTSLDGAPETARQELRHALRGIDPRTLTGQGRLAFRRVRGLASRGLPGHEATRTSLPPRSIAPEGEPETLVVAGSIELPAAPGEQASPAAGGEMTVLDES